MSSLAPQTQNHPSRLALALQTQGLQTLQNQKRKADSPQTPRPTQKVAPSTIYPNLSLHAKRFASASRVASVIIKAGHSQAVAKRVFDQVYQTGRYDRVLIGAPEEKPFFDLSHPRNRLVKQEVVDTVWAWEMKWSATNAETTPISPKEDLKKGIA